MAVCALLALVAFPGLLRLGTDNSPEVFFVRGSEAVERYQAFRDELGSDRIVRLVVRGDGLWTASGLDWLARTEARFSEMPGVISASGLYQHYSRDLWPGADATSDEINSFRERVRSNRLDRGLGWVSEDGSVVTVLAVLEDAEISEERRLLLAMEAELATVPDGVDAELAGPPFLNRALDESSREIERRYFPLLVAFSVVLLLLALGDPRALIAPLLFVGFSELLLLAPMGYVDTDLNMVLSVLPPLIFVIALATAVHLLLRVRDLAGARAQGGVGAADCVSAYREKGWSVLWTGVTTMIGFASLTLSPVAPIRGLGLWAALGLGLMTAAAFTCYPALLALSVGRAGKPRAFERWTHRLGGRWGRWAGRHHKALVLAAVAVAVAGAAGWPRIRVESNALHYLPPSHPVRAQIEDLQAAGIGLAAIEILITTAEPFAEPASLLRLAELGALLEAEPLIHGTMSAGALLRDTAARAAGASLLPPQAHRAVVLRGLEADSEGRAVLDAFLSPDRYRARVTAFVSTVGLEELDPLLARIRIEAQGCFPGASVETTGQFPLLVESQRYLLSTLVWSMALTVAAIALVLRLLLPGMRLAVLALVPNLWPVAAMLGLMGWYGVPLDIATVMVASVVLGLAVDNTLHTLGHFRRLAAAQGAREAVVRSLEITAPACLLTGVILAAGFGVCAFSDFAPVARFGALSAFAIVVAVLGNLFLLPALLCMTPRKTLNRWVLT